jgi:hypothetical protein
VKRLTVGLLAFAGVGSAALAQNAPPAAVVTHKEVRTVTHNDGKPHPQVTRVRHRSIVKTPHGTMVHTTTSTTTTPPK